MKDKNQALIDSFGESLIPLGEGIFENAVDFMEDTIDTIISNPILEAIPICKTILSVIKGVVSIRDRWLLKKTYDFIYYFNKGKVPQEKIIKYKKSFNRDELERILVLLDRQTESQKTSLLANLFLNYIDGQFDFITFIEFSEILDRLICNDIKILKSILDEFIECDTITNTGAYARLAAQGLCNTYFTNIQWQRNDEPRKKPAYHATDYGEKFCQGLDRP